MDIDELGDFAAVKSDLPADAQDEYLIHAVDPNGNSFTYSIKELFWNPNAYDYLKEQEEIFSHHLSELTKDYSGKYILFENGNVIDSDEKEMVLLSRISKNDSYSNRPAIFYKFVPKEVKVNV